MAHHLFCLTVDTDPDGLNGQVPNRRAMSWQSLEAIQILPQELEVSPGLSGSRVPITWFVRADGQLQTVFGTSLYLLEKFGTFWELVTSWGHELGWHPHLYRQRAWEDEPMLMTDASEARDELERVWEYLKASSFSPTAFRNGEGWHSTQTFATVEKFGLICDSTAIPGRSGGPQHPMNWLRTPNQPYFPHPDDVGVAGSQRPLLEIPMTTWRVQAPYDREPRIRYMNPAIHEALFSNALDGWEVTIRKGGGSVYVWVLIFHPDEVTLTPTTDSLYAHSMAALCVNVGAIAARVQQMGHSLEFVTISDAAARWKQQREACL